MQSPAVADPHRPVEGEAAVGIGADGGLVERGDDGVGGRVDGDVAVGGADPHPPVGGLQLLWSGADVDGGDDGAGRRVVAGHAAVQGLAGPDRPEAGVDHERVALGRHVQRAGLGAGGVGGVARWAGESKAAPDPADAVLRPQEGVAGEHHVAGRSGVPGARRPRRGVVEDGGDLVDRRLHVGRRPDHVEPGEEVSGRLEVGDVPGEVGGGPIVGRDRGDAVEQRCAERRHLVAPHGRRRRRRVGSNGRRRRRCPGGVADGSGSAAAVVAGAVTGAAGGAVKASATGASSDPRTRQGDRHRGEGSEGRSSGVHGGLLVVVVPPAQGRP